VTIHSLGSIYSNLAMLNMYLHVRLWPLWCTIESVPVATLTIDWGLVNRALSATEAT